MVVALEACISFEDFACLQSFHMQPSHNESNFILCVGKGSQKPMRVIQILPSSTSCFARQFT
jgi:hypothetical protein